MQKKRGVKDDVDEQRPADGAGTALGEKRENEDAADAGKVMFNFKISFKYINNSSTYLTCG